jgi:hypothetical protein
MSTSFTEQEVRDTFSSHTKSNALAVSNKARWVAMRKEAVRLGIVTPQGHDHGRAIRDGYDAPRQYSEAELLARSQFSEAECRRLLTSHSTGAVADNLAELKKNSPQRYATLVLAASSYGLDGLPSVEQAEQRLSSVPPVVFPTGVEDWYTTSFEMRTRLGLPERVSRDSFNAAIKTLVQLEEADKAAEVRSEAQRVIAEEGGSAVQQGAE